MILLDYSQTVIGSFMAMGRGKPVVEEDLLRHTILNSIRMFRNQFAKDYGEMVICCDGKDNWRKKYFQSTKQIVGKIERMTLRIGKLFLNYYMK